MTLVNVTKLEMERRERERQERERQAGQGDRKVPDRSNLLSAAWLELELPPRDYLFLDMLSTTSRWIIYGETGVGKTLWAMDLAHAAAQGVDFMGWKGSGKRRRVMYLDGELPAETCQERIRAAVEIFGKDAEVFVYNRDVLTDDDLPPLNTEAGQDWLKAEIEAVKPDLIICDSIMALMIGEMSGEEHWLPMKTFVRWMSSQRIAQMWMHHPGHDVSHGFGSKTKEWEMDTVIALAKGDDGDVTLEFKKARLRTPDTAHLFRPQAMRRDRFGWSNEEHEIAPAETSKSPGRESLKRAILNAVVFLADGVPVSSGFDGKGVRKVKLADVQMQVKRRGYLELDDKGHVIGRARTAFNRAKTDLLDKGQLQEEDGAIWQP